MNRNLRIEKMAVAIAGNPVEMRCAFSDCWNMAAIRFNLQAEDDDDAELGRLVRASVKRSLRTTAESIVDDEDDTRALDDAEAYRDAVRDLPPDVAT